MGTMMRRRPAADDDNAYSLVRVETHDADEHATRLQAWDQIYEQLTPGQFEGRLMEIWFNGIQLFREVTNRSIHEAGLVCQGARGIGVPLAMEGTGYYCGQPVGVDDVITLRGGDEFSFRAPPHLDLLAASIPIDVLTSYGREIEHRDIEAELQGLSIIPASKERVDELRQFLLTALTSISRTPSMLQHREMRKALEQAILRSLIGIIGSPEAGPRPVVVANARHTLVSRAQDYMREHVDEALTVEDLCRELGVSRRTLQYSFQEVLQLNPVSYLRAVRLNGVRRMLRAADPASVSVQDVAARWGFWHLSHFAADYKRMFGELPSETLRAPARNATLPVI